MEQLTIRPATLQDMDTLLLFEQGVITAERPYDTSIQDGPINYYNLNAMITEPHIYLVIAEYNGQPVGSAYARIEKARHYLKHPVHAYCGFMYVLPSHRGKGINKKIIDALEAWARSQNVTEMRLDVYHDNTPAIRAYEKAGFYRDILEMRKHIG